MKFRFPIFILIIAAVSANAQIEFVTDNFFPADLEFEALQGIISENHFSDPLQLKDIENGPLISAVGFKDYSQREYNVKDRGHLSIEIVTLIDYRAAYSLLSLLRTSSIQLDTLGDASTIAPGEILFCNGKRWVRILGQNVPGDLLQYVARSVSNRMGSPEKKLPALIAYLPESGLQDDSLRYFPDKRAFEIYNSTPPIWGNKDGYEMEIAEAFYHSENRSGELSLLEFPTNEMAEGFFEDLSMPASPLESKRIFFKISGPLLSILEGSFSPNDAKDILDPIQYGYSVQWIRDKHPQYTVVWGIPVLILQTTVWSFFFVLILCVFSILVGGFLAGLRIFLRHYYPQNPLDDPKRTEITRLKLS